MSYLIKDNDQKLGGIKRNSPFKKTGLKLKKRDQKKHIQKIEFPKINNSYIAGNELSFNLLKFFFINGQRGRIVRNENQQKKFYFITEEENDQYILDSTGKLINITQYKQIDLNQFDYRMKNLIEQINLISQNLDQQFFDELTNLIQLLSQEQIFIQKEQDLTTTINNVIQYVKQQEIAFQYIKEWAQIKQLYQEVKPLQELQRQKDLLSDFLTQLIKIIIENSN